MPKSEEELNGAALDTLTVMQEAGFDPGEAALVLIGSLALLHSPIPGKGRKFSEFLQEAADTYRAAGR